MVDASFDEHFMRMALREAEKAAADGEVPTGCVIVEAPADPAAPPAAARILGARRGSPSRRPSRQRAAGVALGRAST